MDKIKIENPRDFFNGFDAVFCINLDERPDRWEESIKEFKKYGIDDLVERFSATHGKTLNIKTELNDGYTGLTYTLIRLFNEVQRRDLNTFFIFEDDIEFKENFKRDFKKLESVPADWDMLYLGGNHRMRNEKSPKPQIINEDIMKVFDTYAMHAVGLKNKGFINDLISKLSNYNKPNDVCFADIQKMEHVNAYAIRDNFAKQRGSYSNILNKNVGNRDILWKGV